MVPKLRLKRPLRRQKKKQNKRNLMKCKLKEKLLKLLKMLLNPQQSQHHHKLLLIQCHQTPIHQLQCQLQLSLRSRQRKLTHLSIPDMVKEIIQLRMNHHLEEDFHWPNHWQSQTARMSTTTPHHIPTEFWEDMSSLVKRNNKLRLNMMLNIQYQLIQLIQY